MEKEFPILQEVSSCCDDHDFCYATCWSDKEMCDKVFRRCLYSYCDNEINPAQKLG